MIQKTAKKILDKIALFSFFSQPKVTKKQAAVGYTKWPDVLS